MIRRATTADGPDVAVLFRRAFGTLTFLPTLHTPEEDRAFFSGVMGAQEMWVWEGKAARRLLGFAALGDDTLNFLYVDPAVHDRGIGTALLACAKERRPNGFQLWAFQENAGARRFYERHGFVAVEFTDGHGNEEHQPDVRYEWRP